MKQLTQKEINYLPIFLDAVSKNDMIFAHFEENDEKVIIVDSLLNNLSENLNDLLHFKNVHVGLYVIDANIDDILTDIPDIDDCKTVVEAYLVQEIKKLKSLTWQIS